MNRKPRRRPLIAEINITPFTDVILVLLVIFMITTPLLSQSSLNVELPQSSNAKSNNLSTPLNITITKTGSIYLDGKPTTKPQLKEKVVGMQKAAKKVSVLLNIDQSSEFKNVVSVLDVLKELGVRDFNIAAASGKDN